MPDTEITSRRQILEVLAQATDELAMALVALGGAYELLDERQADRLEGELFRAVQRAYGRAQRTHAGFAQRHSLPRRRFQTPPQGAPSTGVKGFIESAVEAVDRAEMGLVALQDSPMFIELGDVELRAGITEVRQLIDRFMQHARAFVRTFGR